MAGGQPENLPDSPLYVNPTPFHRILKRRMTRPKAREATIHAAHTEDDRDFQYKHPERVSSCGFYEDRPNHASESSIPETHSTHQSPEDRYEMENRSDILSIDSRGVKTPEPFKAVAVEDNSPPRVNSDHHFSNWPYNCCYFVPKLMNAEGAISLLNHDAEFHPADSNTPEHLKVVDLTETGSSSFDLSPLESEFDDLLQLSDLNHGSTRILFISQKRRYHKNRTTNRYGLKHSTWLSILSSGDIPPDVVQLIHENNGCWGAHTSYCPDVRGKSCRVKSPDDSLGQTLCAYHIWLKPRPWWNEEHFVYARHGFHSRKKLLLVVGTSLEAQQQRLLSQFHSATQPHLFSVLLALTTTWTKDLEEFVWEQDFDTQRLESDTGWSTVGHTQLKPLPLDKLALRKDMVFTKDALSHVVRASESLSELFIFLSKEVRTIPCNGYNVNLRYNQLKDAFLQQGSKQWHQKRQAQGLIGRIDTQWNVISALMAQHTNSLNFQIARDSRIDTIVMRRISFVTIAFLPATFLATFFSMSFFTSGDITANPTIWIYVVCVIPLTLAIAWQSSARRWFAVRWVVSKLQKKAPKRSDFFEDQGEGIQMARNSLHMA